MRPAFVPLNILIHQKSTKWFLDNLEDIRHKLTKLQKGKIDVSIVIPAYNEQDNILRAISSIADTVSNLSIELIVVDNNSHDLTKDYVLKSGAKYIFEGKPGVENARTTGLKYASGIYIISADADTIYSPHWVNELIKPLQNYNNVAISYGKFAFTPGHYHRFTLYLYELIGEVFKKINALNKDDAMYVYGCSSAYRKHQALAVNGYEHPIGTNEDGYLAKKLRDNFGKMYRVRSVKSFAWTSSRKFLVDGSMLQRIKNKLSHIFQ
jgi:glycosyltransferase involved in cell wall biosynthesis